MSTARFIVGDVFDALATIPDASVDLVLTSPPFLALRSYLPADHPDKAKEIGSEPTPGAFIDTLLSLTEEWARVLTPHGSICVELGDTYAGSGGAGGDYGADGLRSGQPVFDGSAAKHRSVPRSMSAVATADASPPPRLRTRRQLTGWPLDKSLCLVPELYRISLVYGFNPLTGRETPAWRGRNVVRWCRPNPPVGALGDKVRPATSDMIVACKERRRYFDLDAVRTPHTEPGAVKHKSKNHSGANPRTGWQPESDDIIQNPNGAPPLDHWWFDDFDQDAWLIPTQPYKGSHYATWPDELCARPIEAMCPRRVCLTCGVPSTRIVDVQHEPNRNTNGPQSIERKHLDGGSAGYASRADRIATTTGWTDCGHDDWRPGLVLDPFAGSGTTLAVAVGHGRDVIGIDIDERNAHLAAERVGMFLTVETLTETAAS